MIGLNKRIPTENVLIDSQTLRTVRLWSVYILCYICVCVCGRREREREKFMTSTMYKSRSRWGWAAVTNYNLYKPQSGVFILRFACIAAQSSQLNRWSPQRPASQAHSHQGENGANQSNLHQLLARGLGDTHDSIVICYPMGLAS